MTSRTCEEYRGQENGKEDRQADEVRRRKKNFQREVVEENAPEENGISNRLFSSTFIPPLTTYNGRGQNHVKTPKIWQFWRPIAKLFPNIWPGRA